MLTTDKHLEPPRITDGVVMLYYCFDAGYEIQVGNLAKIRGKTTHASLLTYKRLTPPYIQYEVPPLLIRLGKRRLVIDGRTITASVDAKVYVFGVITIRFTLPLSGTLHELSELGSVLTESAILRKKAISEFVKIRNDILQSIIKPRIDADKDFEDYAIFLVKQFDRSINASELLQNDQAEIAGILREERNLSTFEIADALKNPLSYRETDLTLIDWNSAFIVDPESSHDVPDVIEFALIQLLELRLYDHMFDTIIETAYEMLTSMKHRVFPFSKTLQDLLRIKLDISEILDRLMYHLKLIGDLYLAKVYETASKRFYLEQWKAAVRHKMATIESIYKEMWTRIQTTRMVILETAIVVLFIIDIILILVEFFK
jgi:hypothetical protein